MARFDVKLSESDIELMMGIIQDWSSDLDLIYPQNKALFERAEDLYEWLNFCRREIRAHVGDLRGVL